MLLYMVTFTINIPQMLAYIAYMDPMGYIMVYQYTVPKLLSCSETLGIEHQQASELEQIDHRETMATILGMDHGGGEFLMYQSYPLVMTGTVCY